MSMYKQITSIQNQEIKNLQKLQIKSHYRKSQGLFVAEGVNEIRLATLGNYEVEKIFFIKNQFDWDKIPDLKEKAKEIIEISEEIYQKTAYRETTGGVLALLRAKKHNLDDLIFHNKPPLLLIAESPEKPGNIGALVRTADAAGIDAVIVTNFTTDVYNPNVIRSSVGSIFTTQVAMSDNETTLSYLRTNGFQILAAALTEKAENYLKQDFTKPTAIVVGTESTGLTDFWLNGVDKNIIIPMYGKIDSMNVSVSAGIIIFEAVRQRKN